MIYALKCPWFSHLCYSGGKIKKNEMGGHVARMGKRTEVFGILVGISEEREHLEQPGERTFK